MVQPRPGLDVSALVRDVLSQDAPPASRLSHGLRSLLRLDSADIDNATIALQSPYARLFATAAGKTVAEKIGNESKTLDLLSMWSVEVLFEYLSMTWGFDADAGMFGKRFLTVPGTPTDPPALLVLDPAVDLAQSRRLTDEIGVEPHGLVAAFERLRPFLSKVLDERLIAVLNRAGPDAVAELLWVSQPEVVLSRRPKMVPLCAPSPHIPIHSGGSVSTVGILCTDAEGALGVTGAYHGTGPVGTAVTVGSIRGVVKHAHPVQDIVFIPMPQGYVKPPVYAAGGIRSTRAPSEAEQVRFEGVGTGSRVLTRVKSHDAGILRKRATVQLKVQTPADTNTGDSGSALVDDDDRVIGFGFERTAPGDFSELTDWVWAANALAALGLTPI